MVRSEDALKGVCELHCGVDVKLSAIAQYNAHFFRRAYDHTHRLFSELPSMAREITPQSRKAFEMDCDAPSDAPEGGDGDDAEFSGSRPLRCLDIFAGAGGLSRGLDDVGATTSEWSIEFVPEAAKACVPTAWRGPGPARSGPRLRAHRLLPHPCIVFQVQNESVQENQKHPNMFMSDCNRSSSKSDLINRYFD